MAIVNAMTRARQINNFSQDESRGRPSRSSPQIRCQTSSWPMLALASILLTSGCSKKPATVSAPVPAGSPIATAEVLPEVQPDLPELNRSLLRWMLGHRHAPKDFEEFAATAGVAIQPPPAGKKYFIRKDMHIVLVDR